MSGFCRFVVELETLGEEKPVPYVMYSAFWRGWIAAQAAWYFCAGYIKASNGENWFVIGTRGCSPLDRDHLKIPWKESAIIQFVSCIYTIMGKHFGSMNFTWKLRVWLPYDPKKHHKEIRLLIAFQRRARHSAIRGHCNIFLCVIPTDDKSCCHHVPTEVLVATRPSPDLDPIFVPKGDDLRSAELEASWGDWEIFEKNKTVNRDLCMTE